MKNKEYKYALHYYYYAKDYEGMKKAIDAGANINLPIKIDMRGTRTVLSRSVSGRDSTAFNLLVSLGADVNAKDSDKCTPLHQAALYYGGNYGRAKILIENGANVNAIDERGFTPLDCLKIHAGKDLNAMIPNEAQGMYKLLVKNGAICIRTKDKVKKANP